MRTRKEEGRPPWKDRPPNTQEEPKLRYSSLKVAKTGNPGTSGKSAKSGTPLHFHLALLRLTASLGILAAAAIGASLLVDASRVDAALASILIAAAIIAVVLPTGGRS